MVPCIGSFSMMLSLKCMSTIICSAKFVVDNLTFLCRNFPQGTISDMVNDASQGISFVCNHIAEYGGDPNR